MFYIITRGESSVAVYELTVCLSIHPSIHSSLPLSPNLFVCLSQVFQGTAGLLEETVKGPIEQLSAALLEIMQHYVSQGAMLAEVQALHSR